MPAVVVASIIGAAATTAGTIYASKKQGSAADKAADISSQNLDKQIAWEREQADTSRKQFDEQVALLRKAHEDEQAELNRKAALEEAQIAEERGRYQAKEARMQPYRETGLVSLKDLAARAQQGTPAPNVPAMASSPRDVMQAPPPASGFREYVSPYDPRNQTRMSDFARQGAA